MPRPPLSFCVVTYNEAAHIADCLRSADFADEWVVIDSHSTDATRDIATALGARVIERDWPGHIEQKNFALDAATHDWVLSLDADERVSPGLRAAILRRLEADDLPDGFTMARLTWYMGRPIRHGGWYPDAKLRLFRKSRGRWIGTNPHDRARVEGRVERLPGDLLHHSYASLSDHLRRIDAYGDIAAREMLARGRRAGLFDLTLRPFAMFLRSYVLKRGFLDGVPGFAVAITAAFHVFMKYAKLRDLQRAPDG